MKKILTFALTLSLVCCLASCNNSDDESSKTSDSQAAKTNTQSTTTTTTASTTTTTTTTAEKTTTTTTTEKTTTTTTTPETTTTTAQTFDTSYYKYESSQLKVAKYDISLYAAPDKSSEVLYNSTEGAVLEIIGEANNDWEVALVDGNIVFVEKFAIKVSTKLYTAAPIEIATPIEVSTPEMYWFSTSEHIVHKDGCELISPDSVYVFTSDLDYALRYDCKKCELCFSN